MKSLKIFGFIAIVCILCSCEKAFMDAKPKTDAQSIHEAKSFKMRNNNFIDKIQARNEEGAISLGMTTTFLVLFFH